MKKLCLVSLSLLLGAQPLAALQAPAARAPAKPAPSPTPPPTLEGTVKGPDGKPVEGAIVIARSTDYTEPLISTRSAASGRFRLSVRRVATYTVRVEAQGLAGVTIEKARPGPPLDVALGRGVVLEGIVRDGATGQPVAQARVQARPETELSPPWEPTAGLVQTLTDAKGRFRLEGVARGPQSVSASVPGAGSGRRSAALPGRPVEIYLFPGATLSGTVWGPGDVRVMGAVVRVVPDVAGFRSAPAPVVSDAEGRYEVAGLEPGRYRVAARHEDFAPELTEVLVERNGDTRADLSLDKGTAVVGRLVSGPEHAVAGRVVVQELDGRSAAELRDLLRGEAGADGRFRLEMLPPGAHVIGIVALGYASKRVDVQVRPGAREVDLGDVELETGRTIRGRVRDDAGRPIAGASLTTYSTEDSEPSSVQALSETDGSFVLAGLQPGTHQVRASASGYAGAERSAEAGAERVDLTLSPAGSISGLVTDDAGRPVEAFRVIANPTRREGPAGERYAVRRQGRMVSAADGRFLLENLGAANYVVEVSATGRSGAFVSDVKVTAGATTDVGTIRLSSGGTVRGTVVDTSGAAVPGAAIAVRGPGRDYGGAQDVTDPGGAFEVGGVAPGTVTISAQHPSYAPGQVSGIEADPAKGTSETRIVLSQGGRIEGWVRRRDRTGVAAASVYVVPLAQRGGPVSGAEMLLTNADGGFASERIPPGRVTVMLMSRSGSTYTSVQSTDVDVREGETTPVEIRARDILVSGRVTRAGAPVAGARITLTGAMTMEMTFGDPTDEIAAAPSGLQHRKATTAEDGSYEMIADAPGRVYVDVRRPGGNGGYPGREVELPDADAYTLDLAFAGAVLSGLVVDGDTDKPVPHVHVIASPKKHPEAGEPGISGAETGEDGRFQLDLEPGDYRVAAFSTGYGRAEIETSVGSGGGSEVRLALVPGLTLAGRTVDERGRGVGGLSVFALAANADGGLASRGSVTSLPDGTFEIGGLRPLPHRVIARSNVGSYALRDGVRPGDKNVVLTLRPSAHVTVYVTGPDGQPVAGAMAFLEGVCFMSTDTQGMAELNVPAGTVELRASKDRLEGRTTVTTAEGGSATVEVRLAPPPRVAATP